MALPVIKHPTFTTELKNFGKIKFRNFINAEHKSLLAAIELGDSNSIFNTTLDIVNACTDSSVDATKLTEAELEFLFLKIYIRSVQNKVEGQYRCYNLVDAPVEQLSTDTGEPSENEVEEVATTDVEAEEVVHPKIECGAEFKIVIPIDSAEISYPAKFEESKVVAASKEVNIHLRVPAAHEKNELLDLEEDDTVDMRVIFSYFDYAHDLVEDSKTLKADIKFEDFNDWFGTISPDAVEKIIVFIENEPQLGYDFKITCPTCKNKDVVKFRGMQSFFE